VTHACRDQRAKRLKAAEKEIGALKDAIREVAMSALRATSQGPEDAAEAAGGGPAANGASKNGASKNGASNGAGEKLSANGNGNGAAPLNSDTE